MRKESDTKYWKGRDKCVIVTDVMAQIIAIFITFVILFTWEREEREVALWRNLLQTLNSSSFKCLLCPHPLLQTLETGFLNSYLQHISPLPSSSVHPENILMSQPALQLGILFQI